MIRYALVVLLLATCCAAVLSYLPTPSAPADQPNVILLMADDMGYECLSVNGSTSYRTPRLDALATEGIRFTNCISQPLCTPSRVKIMTGQRNYRNYTYFGYLDSDQQTFGHVMQQAGYATCIVGKWQLNGLAYDLPGKTDVQRPQHFGFDEYSLWQLTKARKEGERFANPLIQQNGKLLPRDPNAYGPDIFCEYALDFIQRNRSKPFFLYYPMVLVHDPFVPTPDNAAWQDPSRRYEKDTAYFAEMVSYTDKIVGRILDKLEELEIGENTLFIFTADNGTHPSIISHTKSGPVQGAKGNTIMAGTHVPMIASWPKYHKQGSVHSDLVSFSDFFPTFAGIVDRNYEVDGKSFLSVIKGQGQSTRETAFVHYDPQWGARVNQFRNQFVQTIRYKLYQDGSMFDIVDDPLELTPLSPDDGRTKHIRSKLQAALDLAPKWEPVKD
ncbi:MAG: sulfatase-like hydrolase/transferase [Saprospiraceae bacterium]|nr:sulfatase-like hydrolase/transferase [Saprospiraceae bacterium]